MRAPPPAPWFERALAPLIIAAAWACYGPLAVKYITVLGTALCCLLAIYRRQGVDPKPAIPALALIGALLAWLTVTALWTPAGWRDIRTHLWLYAQMLLVPLLAIACPPDAARRGLLHFGLASVVVALVFVLARLGVLPTSSWMWHTTVDAEGNQRIATSILLALGTCMCAWLGLDASGHRRWAWWCGTLLCVMALALQDRRTGMLLLPAALLAWAWARQPTAARRLGMAAAIVAAMSVAWQVSDGVRGRFSEGISELRQYSSTDAVDTSWGQRLRMWEVTASMVSEHPLIGNGIGSWQILWRQRITPGTALVGHSTPHNEYLLLAQQGGVIALGLWLAILAVGLRTATRAGPWGVPAVLAWTSLAGVGLFNAVLRDAKFGLPLILLAALASVAARPGKSRTEPA